MPESQSRRGVRVAPDTPVRRVVPARYPGSPGALIVAVAASLALHALVVTLPRWESRPPHDVGLLTVRLAPAPLPLPEPRPVPSAPAAPLSAPPEPVPQTPPEVLKDTMPRPAPERVAPRERKAPVPVVPRAQTKPSLPPRPGPVEAEPLPQRQLESAYERLAQDDLLYPEEAIRRGIEGEVVLLIEVGAGGQILQASVAASSGHRILDEAAIRAVRRLGSLGTANAGKSVLFPVRFRLT